MLVSATSAVSRRRLLGQEQSSVSDRKLAAGLDPELVNMRRLSDIDRMIVSVAHLCGENMAQTTGAQGTGSQSDVGSLGQSGKAGKDGQAGKSGKNADSGKTGTNGQAGMTGQSGQSGKSTGGGAGGGNN